jgi:hypothetical protein
VIITVAGSPVLTVRDLSVLTRGPLQPGTEVEVRYLRGDQLLVGTGAI